jgi:predicted SAM-dependent methyltransferase
MLILNVAGGKFNPLPIENDNLLAPKYILNVDTSYFRSENINVFEENIKEWELDPDRISKLKYLNMDVFEFMERTVCKFDRVVIYRFLEHVSFTQVEYFIYLVSTVLKKGGIVDVIVPNYRMLAFKLLDEEQMLEDPNFNFPAHNILLTTELLNEPSCPHASIWTTSRMRYFWHLENRFIIDKQDPKFNFDGRDIYLRSIIKRL